MLKTVIHIEGMACSMCESHINDAVRQNFTIKKVTSSHKKCKAEIISETPLDVEKLKNIITEAGYTAGDVKTEEYEQKGFFSKLFGGK